MAKRKWVIAFAPFMALATLLAVPLQLNGLLIMWKIHQAKQNDAIRAALLCDETALHVIDHLTHALLRRIHPGNRDEVFIWQNFPARLPTQAALSYEHIENFTKDLEARRDHETRPARSTGLIWKGPQIKVSVWLLPCARVTWSYDWSVPCLSFQQS